EGMPLPARFQESAGENEQRPEETAVTRDLFRPQEQARPAFGRPAGPRGCIVAAESLPQWKTDEPHEGDGHHQEGPFAGGALRGRQCHGGAPKRRAENSYCPDFAEWFKCAGWTRGCQVTLPHVACKLPFIIAIGFIPESSGFPV